MPNPMGLTGVNNPIFQASQTIVDQTGQQKQAAVQGIIQQTLNREAEKLGAQMKTYATFMQSKDPFIFQKGVEGMYGAMDKLPPQDIMARQEEMRTAFTELSRLEGKVSSKAFQEAVMGTIERFGQAPEGMEERARSAAFDPLKQPITPEIAKKYGLPETTTIEQAKALGVNLSDTDAKDTATASLREFEMVKGISSAMRGTPQYQKMYEDWLKVKNPGAGSGNTVILMTDQGAMKVNKQTGVAEPVKTDTGGGLAKPLPVGAAEGIAELDSLQTSIKNVENTFKPEYVGPVDTVIGSITGYSGIGADEGYQEFIANISALRKTLFEEGGKNLTANEMSVLADLIPNKWSSAAKFKAQMKVFKDKYQDILNKKVKAYKETGYGVPTTSGGSKRPLDSFGR